MPVSGPVSAVDAPPDAEPVDAAPTTLQLAASREARVGSLVVRRALPMRARRTVGAWCFADHFGPVPVGDEPAMAVGPHPHIGLQTVTWLLAGELLHRDSLGSEAPIRPGQLNLMTAGHGVSHAEESTTHRGELHGVQLWVAQPEATRDGPPSFEQLTELPQGEFGTAIVTVLVGDYAGVVSDARRDTDHVGIEARLRRGTAVLPLRSDYEYAVVVLDGAVQIDALEVRPGVLGYLGTGRDECVVVAADEARLLVLGGAPFDSKILMWWNFVARTHAEVEAATSDWNEATGRFGETGSALARLTAPPVPWQRP